MGVLKSTVGLCVMLAVAASIRCEYEVSEVEAVCAKEYDLDPFEAYTVINSNETISEEIMCYAKCYLEKNEMLAADGSVILDKAFEKMFPNQTDSEDVKSAFEVALTECNSQFNKINCELAGNVYRCLKSALDVEEEE